MTVPEVPVLVEEVARTPPPLLLEAVLPVMTLPVSVTLPAVPSFE